MTSEYRQLFSTKLAKGGIAFHAVSIVAILTAIIVLQVDFPSFLVVQLLLLATLWLDNGRLNVSLNLLRASFIFSIIYVSYTLLLAKNTFMEFAALVYFVSWLYLQVKTETSRLQVITSGIQ